MNDATLAAGITIILISAHYTLEHFFGEAEPWGIIIYFLVLIAIKVDKQI